MMCVTMKTMHICKAMMHADLTAKCMVEAISTKYMSRTQMEA